MNKETIVEFATQQFLTNGYKTVTMDEIATELGISKKTLYEQVGNKIKLVKASVQYQLNELQELFDDVQKQNLNAIDEIVTLAYKIKNCINTPGHNTALYQLQKYYTSVYNKIYTSQLEFAHGALKSNLIKGQEQNFYRSEVNPDCFAEIVMITQNSLKCTGSYLEDVHKINQMSDIHFDLVLRGILTSEGLAEYQNLEILSNEK